MRGLDYSAGRISGAAIRAAGYDFVVRYVDQPSNTNRKLIRPDEYRDLLEHGVKVWLVFEQWTTDALGGFKQGVAYARRALAGADALGYKGIIFFCSDMHLTREQIPTALGYLDGAASVIGRERVGAYGFWEFLDAAIPLGKASAYWQAGIRPAPNDPKQIWQNNNMLGGVRVGGVQCDVNELLRPMPEPGTPPAPPPAPPTPTHPENDVVLPDLHPGDGTPGTGDRGRLHWYVLSLQALLNVRGLTRRADLTGVFCDETASLVRQLQHRSGIPVTGNVDAETWRWVLGNDAPDFA